MCDEQDPTDAARRCATGLDAIGATILRYVASRPDACDTLDGICEWWIPRQRYLEARHDVLAALECLQAQSRIGMRAGADGQVLYHAPRAPSA
ncbi:MAG: hypothetical protein ABIV63_02525 [Caldimonas sp.]